ncbi:MAG: hypothetical protein HY072_01140, partial [Deltaproteobacteria bacterium]|nr:hypothetical protein [Deltaproteobacteria bacterium]
LKLSHVFVYAGRGEDYICEHSVQSIVVRAVAPVDKIYKWIKNCSTWNNLILFKGPKWPKPNAEWDLFSKKHSNRVLKIENKYHYQVGTAKKQRVIVNLINAK